MNNAGTITNSSVGTGTVTLSGSIGGNVTNITQNSSTSQLTLSGSNPSYAGLTTILNGQLNVSSSPFASSTATNAIAINGGQTSILSLSSDLGSTHGLWLGSTGGQLTGPVSGTGTVDGVISGTGPLIINGCGHDDVGPFRKQHLLGRNHLSAHDVGQHPCPWQQQRPGNGPSDRDQ